MLEIDITADQLVSALLHLAASEPVSILDSCGVGHLGSHLLIAGIRPVETLQFSSSNADETLQVLDEKLCGEYAAIFTISYDFGVKLLNIRKDKGEADESSEPDLFLSLFDTLIVHDYDIGRTFLTGNPARFDHVADALHSNTSDLRFEIVNSQPRITSNFTKPEYLKTIETVKEQIRSGNTYQTNLTQQLTAQLPEGLTPEIIFARLRLDHPAPFSAFLKRPDSTVISASPERFFKGGNPTRRKGAGHTTITTSPIKGTRPRGKTPDEDETLKHDLLTSQKDRAENTMIVDLLRNDLGRICEFGTVRVEKLCELEEHPTLFHLVSTVSGELREDTKFADILKALLPCGSITGAPKISTMQLIDRLEPTNRRLSMGAIGYCVPGPKSKVPSHGNQTTWDFGLGPLDSPVYDLSVAIRTMVVRDGTVTFNVGGGIVIDSDPESEYAETLTKAKALLAAIGASSDSHL